MQMNIISANKHAAAVFGFSPEEIVGKKYNLESKGEKCPSCGEHTLIHSDGCVQCISCGWSKCG